MGTNALVQFLLQPILIGGVLFHFIMGFILEIENRKAVSIGYAKVDGGKNSTWMSRNMIWSGIVILAFLVLHFIDFWFPEISYKYIEFLPDDPNRYYAELIHKFENPYRVGAYCFAFILLALHLLHGFTSSLKSLGTNKMYSQSVKVFFVVLFSYGYGGH